MDINEIIQDYCIESLDILEDAEQHILNLEKDTSKVEHINLLFLLYHNLMSSSLACGIENLAEHLQKLEHICDATRNGKIPVNDHLINTLTKINDNLQNYISELNKDIDLVFEAEPNPDFDKLVKKATGKSEPEPEPKAETKTEERGEHPFHILFCDDEDGIRSIVESVLGKYFQVSSYGNGKEAFEAFMAEPKKFNAILSDIKMPLMDGVEFITKVRETDANIPVVFISGIEDHRLLKNCMKLKPFGFIDKPINHSNLNVILNNACKLQSYSQGINALATDNFKLFIKINRLMHSLDQVDKLTNEQHQMKEAISKSLDQIATRSSELLKIS